MTLNLDCVFLPILCVAMFDNWVYAFAPEGMLKRILQLRFATTVVPDGTIPSMSNLPIVFPEDADEDMVRERSPDSF